MSIHLNYTKSIFLNVTALETLVTCLPCLVTENISLSYSYRSSASKSFLLLIFLAQTKRIFVICLRPLKANLINSKLKTFLFAYNTDGKLVKASTEPKTEVINLPIN